MRKSPFACLLILIFVVFSHSSLAQFFVDVSKTLAKQDVLFSTSGRLLGGNSVNFGFEKTLSADNHFSNEFMLSYFQNRHLDQFTNLNGKSERISIHRNLGVSARLFYNHKFKNMSSSDYRLSFGLSGGIHMRGTTILSISPEDYTAFFRDDLLRKRIGAIVRFRVKNLYVQANYSLHSSFGAFENGWRTIFYGRGETSHLIAGVGYQFGNR